MQRKINATWLKDRIQNPNAPILHCLKLNQFKFQNLCENIKGANLDPFMVVIEAGWLKWQSVAS